MDLKILLNGHKVPAAWITRVAAPEGQPRNGRLSDRPVRTNTPSTFAWAPLDRILVNGDNELSMRLLGAKPGEDGEVVINEPEVYVSVCKRPDKQ